MKVSIVIPNWNGAEKLRRNLPKVLKVRGVSEVIVSDDASTDDSVEVVQKHFSKVKLIKREKNGGFSSNVNTGVSHASGDLIFLLNTDAVPETDCLEHILFHFKTKGVFSVGFNTGGSWSWAKFKDGFFWHQVAKEVPKEAHQTLWVSGGSGVFRKKIWDKLGGLDELFNPFYEEDVDLGYRASKGGYINLWEPKAKVEHYKETGVIKENFTESTVAKIAQRNQLIFIWKNITSKKLFNQHISELIKKLISNPKYFMIFFAAFKSINKIANKRDVEKKQAKVSDEEILDKYQI